MAAEIENLELVNIKNQIDEVNETLEIVFRIIEKRLSKLEVLFRDIGCPRGHPMSKY